MTRCAICDAKLPVYQPLDDELCSECHKEIDRVYNDPEILEALMGEEPY